MSALRTVEEMDAGLVCCKRYLSLDGRAEDIYMRAGQISLEIIQWIIGEQPTQIPQQEDVVKFKRQKPSQRILPLTGHLHELYDRILMLDVETYPRAFIEYGSYRQEFTFPMLESDQITATVSIRLIATDEKG